MTFTNECRTIKELLKYSPICPCCNKNISLVLEDYYHFKLDGSFFNLKNDDFGLVKIKKTIDRYKDIYKIIEEIRNFTNSNPNDDSFYTYLIIKCACKNYNFEIMINLNHNFVIDNMFVANKYILLKKDQAFHEIKISYVDNKINYVKSYSLDTVTEVTDLKNDAYYNFDIDDDFKFQTGGELLNLIQSLIAFK